MTYSLGGPPTASRMTTRPALTAQRLIGGRPVQPTTGVHARTNGDLFERRSASRDVRPNPARRGTIVALHRPGVGSRPSVPSDRSAIEARRAALGTEVIDENGTVRPAYEGIVEVIEGLDPARKARALKESKKLFRGDNALDPVPRLLLRSEFESLKAGVVQRATALRMFLADHYSGEKRYAAVIAPEKVEAIIARNHQADYEAWVDPKRIAFPYGPDIMRDESGRFYVIEDNTGWIGGPGDLLKARETLFEMVPEYETRLTPVDQPIEYFEKLVQRAQALATPKGGKVVMFMVPPFPDHEDDRLAEIMERVGVEIVTTRTASRLVANDDGVFISRKDADGLVSLEPVGFVFLNGEHHWMDASHPATRSEFLLGTAAEALEDNDLTSAKRRSISESMRPKAETGRISLVRLERTLRAAGALTKKEMHRAVTAKGLMQAIFDGKVATNYSPGIDFIGDKELKGYVDDLVRFYLKEEPLLEGVPVHRFTKRDAHGREQLDEAALHALFDDDAYKNYVFKIVNGRGGDGVHIGPKIASESVPELMEKIRRDASHYIAEPYKHLSTLDGHIVDLRFIAAVDPDRVEVSSTPWGRGVPVDGDGKVNIGQHGKEFTVLVIENPKPSRSTVSRMRWPRFENRAAI